MRIGIDLDGVCYRFENAVRRHLMVNHGYTRESLPDPIGWNLEERWGMNRDQFRAFCDEGVDADIIFTYGAPYPKVIDGVQAIARAGHSIHVVTARGYGQPGASESATARWLDTWNIPFDTLTFAHDKTVARTDIMIDDKLENYDELEAAGTHAVLMDQKWNQDIPGGKTRNRVKDMLEFADLIQGMQ